MKQAVAQYRYKSVGLCPTAEVPKSRLFSVYLAFHVILNIYYLPLSFSISLGEVFLLPVMVALFFKYGKIDFYRKKIFWFFLAYAFMTTCFVTFAGNFSYIDPVKRCIRDAMYWVLIFGFCHTFLDYAVFKKWVIRLCIVLSCMILLQQLVYLLAGVYVPGFILNARIASADYTGIEVYGNALENARRVGYLKACGFLTEGAHCAVMLSIGSVMLFDRDFTKVRNFLILILFLLAMCATFAASGFAYAVVVCICFFITQVRRKQHRVVAFIFGVLLIALPMGLVLLIKSDIIHSIVSRLFGSVSIDTIDGSAYARLYKGFSYWSKLPFANKIFGIGFGNYHSFNSAIGNIFSQNEYMNTASYILVSSGAIGILLFGALLYKISKRSNCVATSALIMMLVVCFTDSVFNSVFWVWFLIVVLFNQKGAKSVYVK